MKRVGTWRRVILYSMCVYLVLTLQNVKQYTTGKYCIGKYLLENVLSNR